MAAKIPLKDLIKNSDFPSSITAEEAAKGKEVLDILYRALLGADHRQAISPALPDLPLRYSTLQSVTLGIIPLDFYAWQLWRPDDAISVCVAGTPSEKTFHRLARGKFREHADKIAIERGDISEASFDLQISTIKIKLRYHQNPLIARWTGVKQADIDEVRDNLPWQSQERLEELERSQEVANQLALQGIEVMRKAYFMYELWAKNTGLSPTYIRRKHILTLAMFGLFVKVDLEDFNQLHLPLPEDRDDIASTAMDLGLVNVKCLKGIWSLIHHALEDPGHVDVKAVNYHQSQWPLFFIRYDSYMRIEANFWGSSRVSAEKWLNTVKSAVRNALLPEILTTPSLWICQLWPCPFVEHKVTDITPHSSTDELSDSKMEQEHGFPDDLGKFLDKQEVIEETHAASQERPNFEISFFIGMTTLDDSRDSLKADLLESHLHSVWKNAFNWEEDPASSFTRCSFIYGDELCREFRPFKPYPVAIPEDIRKLPFEENDEVPPEPEVPSAPSSTPQGKTNPKSKSKSKSKSKTKNEPQAGTSQEQLTAKLRPAQDVLHRIRHDGTFKTDDILIGYLDRHTGIKEIPFDWWTAENTAEEFIPQSRIRFFKRKSDGVVIWDREKRIDLVFGTGVKE